MAEIDRIQAMLTSAPVNIEAIIRSLGIELEKDAALPQGISGQIERTDRGFKISSASGEHYFRQRFSLAHELGHYVLHKDLIGAGIDDSVKYRSDPNGNFYNTSIELAHERQANSFAANVLMPRRLVVEAWNSGVRDVGQLLRKFQVSRSAMEWRLRNLGLHEQAVA